MCSINVCGFNSKLKYKTLENYITQFDIICLTETKCDDLIDNIAGFTLFVMAKKHKKHKHGGIHGICIFIREHIASNCTIINEFLSESILWLHVKNTVLGYDFILGAVYLPYETSDYYNDDVFDFLADDIITVKATYDVPIILLGDFNSRVGTQTDIQCELTHDGLNFDNNPHLPFFENHNLMNRVNKDTYVNKNGKQLLELCKMSDLKIVNGRIGRDRDTGNYTCHSSNGKSTIDYAVLSMELYPHIVDFYVDIFDKCMSDVHCPICLVMSCNSDVSTDKANDCIDNSKYSVTTNVRCRWNEEMSEQYTLSFDMETIENFQIYLRNIILNMCKVTQDIIDNMYIDMKELFIQPAKKTGIYKVFDKKPNTFIKKTRRHGKQSWYNNECDALRRKCMSMKKSLKVESSSSKDLQLFHEHVNKYKKLVVKTKKKYSKKFHTEIRNLKSRNPREFWKIISSESNNKSEASKIMFSEFVDHFREINKDPLFNGATPQSHESMSELSTNDTINHQFTIMEIKSAIKRLKNSKTSGADSIINEFFQHCHRDCLQIITDFFNIVLNTGYVPTEWCLGIIHPLYKNKGPVTDPDNYRGITLLSCTSKLFTACLNQRLSTYVDDNILGEEQAGFRKGYSKCH